MRWNRARRSDNVVDARGRSGMRLGGGLGLGGIAIVVVIGLLSGQDPLQILGQLANQGGPAVSQQSQRPAGDDPQVEFVRAVLGDTEDTWRALFQQNGVQYRDPTLVLFRGGVNSACGFASLQSARSIAPAISRSTSTCSSSTRWPGAFPPPVTLPRPM